MPLLCTTGWQCIRESEFMMHPGEMNSEEKYTKPEVLMGASMDRVNKSANFMEWLKRVHRSFCLTERVEKRKTDGRTDNGDKLRCIQ